MKKRTAEELTERRLHRRAVEALSSGVCRQQTSSWCAALCRPTSETSSSTGRGYWTGETKPWLQIPISVLVGGQVRPGPTVSSGETTSGKRVVAAWR